MSIFLGVASIFHCSKQFIAPTSISDLMWISSEGHIVAHEATALSIIVETLFFRISNFLMYLTILDFYFAFVNSTTLLYSCTAIFPSSFSIVGVNLRVLPRLELLPELATLDDLLIVDYLSPVVYR
jgi:hypothetical protein